MAQLIGNNQVKLNNGQTVTAQQGGWYDGKQYWGGTLSEAGQINSLSNQVGAGQMVSAEVNAQSAAQQGVSPQQFESYLQTQRQQQPTTTPTPTGMSTGAKLPSATGTTGAGMGAITTPETLNLPKLYESLYQSSGIRDIEANYSTMEKQFIEAKGKVNDNPFLSEATRVGRIAKLESLFNERTANIKNDIATKKADIETQLNLQTKQFDINSQAAQQALSQFNSLLAMGALDNASGEDIANLTRTTGISSDMIYSAINANKAKNAKTEMITSTADSGEVTVSVINSETGEIIKQTSLGKVGNAQTGSATQTKAQEDEANRESLITSIKNYNNLRDLVARYNGVMDIEDIYQLYNMYSPFGVADEDIEDVKLGKFNA